MPGNYFLLLSCFSLSVWRKLYYFDHLPFCLTAGMPSTTPPSQPFPPPRSSPQPIAPQVLFQSKVDSSAFFTENAFTGYHTFHLFKICYFSSVSFLKEPIWLVRAVFEKQTQGCRQAEGLHTWGCTAAVPLLPSVTQTPTAAQAEAQVTPHLGSATKTQGESLS